jgi:hypothetical protein
MAIINGRWSDTLNNPWGPGDAIPGARNLIDIGSVFLTYDVNAPGTFVPNLTGPAAPIFPLQDGCPSPLFDAFPVGDDVGDWKRYVIANGMHDWSASLATDIVESGNNQGWYAPALRIDETGTTTTGGVLKLFQPLWAYNFTLPNAGLIFANYVLNNYGSYAGINFEYFEVPDWMKNWATSYWWTTILDAAGRAAFSASWRVGAQDAITRLHAAGKIVTGQQCPSGTSAYETCVNGMFRENNPGALISPKTNAACIANDQQHKTAIAAVAPAREYISIWHVWHPLWVPGLNYYDERLGRFTANQTEHDALIEHWKEIAAATPGSAMAIGDGGNTTASGGYDLPWPGPPLTATSVPMPLSRTGTSRAVRGTLSPSVSLPLSRTPTASDPVQATVQPTASLGIARTPTSRPVMVRKPLP